MIQKLYNYPVILFYLLGQIKNIYLISDFVHNYKISDHVIEGSPNNGPDFHNTLGYNFNGLFTEGDKNCYKNKYYIIEFRHNNTDTKRLVQMEGEEVYQSVFHLVEVIYLPEDKGTSHYTIMIHMKYIHY